jgi:hypothetical protein
MQIDQRHAAINNSAVSDGAATGPNRAKRRTGSAVLLKKKWQADHVVIEDAGGGKSLWQDLHADRRAKGRDAFTPHIARLWVSIEERLIRQTASSRLEFACSPIRRRG